MTSSMLYYRGFLHYFVDAENVFPEAIANADF